MVPLPPVARGLPIDQCEKGRLFFQYAVGRGHTTVIGKIGDRPRLI